MTARTQRIAKLSGHSLLNEKLARLSLYEPGKLTGLGLLVMTSTSSQGKLLTVHGTVTGRMLSSAPQFEELPRRSFSSSLTPRQRAVLGMLVDGKLTIDGDSGPRTFSKDELLGIFSGQQLPRDAKVCSFLGLPDPNADFSSLERRLMSIGE